MRDQDLTRRSFVKQSLAVAGPAMLAASALPLVTAEAESGSWRKLKVVCVGGHPDDPESGCAGTLMRYTELGHSVTIIYLTRGERGISGKSLDEAARIRSAECEAACKIMGAKPVFFGQIDGATELTATLVAAFVALDAKLTENNSKLQASKRRLESLLERNAYMPHYGLEKNDSTLVA